MNACFFFALSLSSTVSGRHSMSSGVREGLGDGILWQRGMGRPERVDGRRKLTSTLR